MAQDVKLDEISSSLDSIFELSGGDVVFKQGQGVRPVELSGQNTCNDEVEAYAKSNGKKRRKCGGFKVLIESMGIENRISVVSHQGKLVIIRLNSDYKVISSSQNNFEMLRMHAVYALLAHIAMSREYDSDPRQMLLALDAAEPETKYFEAAGKVFHNIEFQPRHENAMA